MARFSFTTLLHRLVPGRLILGAVFLVSVGLASAGAADPETPSPDDVIGNSVVKLYGTTRAPDFGSPWKRLSPTDISGSGLVIEGHRILTNAHMVMYTTNLEVQGSQGGDRVPAHVVAVAPGIDLAVLAVDDDAFFATRPPLKRGGALPRVKDPVFVYGYPAGGDSLSITKGIVSRIEFVGYGGLNQGLRIQIDAAINHGNSGGPVLVGDTVIGLAFSFLGGTQNIGYIIPNEEIDLMLAQTAQGAYRGRLASEDQLQSAENPTLRRYLKLPPSVHGAMLVKTDPAEPRDPLQRWDVVTRVGSAAVDDQGMVQPREGLHVAMDYLFEKEARDGRVPLTVYRGGAFLKVDLPVKPSVSALFPDLAGAYPSYFIYGPVVFSKAYFQYEVYALGGPLAGYLAERGSPLISRINDTPGFPGEELVVIPSTFFPSPLTKGYSDPQLRVVKSLNGTPVRNLLHLVSLLRDSRDPYVIIEFADLHTEKLVFRRADLAASTEQILENNSVRARGSPDTLEEWNRKL